MALERTYIDFTVVAAAATVVESSSEPTFSLNNQSIKTKYDKIISIFYKDISNKAIELMSSCIYLTVTLPQSLSF